MPRYALIVGIGHYHVLQNLSKPEGDAQTVHDLLKQQGDFDHIHLLNHSTVPDGVTFEVLNDALVTLLEKRADRSEVLIYFTGHGFMAGETADDREGYLATGDCQVEMDGDAILSQRRGLSFKRLNKLVGRSKASSLVMLLDCCHGGYFIEDGLVKAGLDAFRDRNYCLIAACRGFEQAYAEHQDSHSLFTTALVQGLQAEPDRGEITALRLFQGIKTGLKGVGQEPILLHSGQDVMVLRLAQQRLAPTVSERCPYQGLNAFTPETRAFFFGREAEVGRVVRRLEQANFVPVIGPSGSGKSSVVRAGVVLWVQAVGGLVLGPMKPGPEPLAELKRCFLPVFDKFTIGSVYRALERRAVADVVALLPPGERYVLVVDQFEEVFTVCTNQEQRQEFIHLLTQLGQQPGMAFQVVTTMRSDFVTAWLGSNPLIRVIQDNAVWLGPLEPEGLRDAIVCPAQKQGYDLEPGLLEVMQRDVAQETHCLPLLEFALTELWQQRDQGRRQLTLAAYTAMGGLRGALRQRADALYDQALNTELEQAWCRQLCLELVYISLDGNDTRCRCDRGALLGKGATVKEREVIERVLEVLIEGRLLVAHGETVDLAHEALMGAWPLFEQWRQQDRDRLRLIQRLKDAYQEWQQRQRSEAYLVQGGLLAELRERWAILKQDKLAAELMDFFRLSDDQERENVAVLERALAETQLRDECTRINSLPGNNPLERTLRAIQAVGLSLKGFQNQVLAPAQDALHRAWTHPCECLRLQGHNGWVNAVAFSPHGDRMVSGGADGTLRLWDLTGRQIGDSFQGHGDWVLAVTFSPQGDAIVSGGADGTLRLWDLAGRQLSDPFQGHGAGIRAVAFSPQGDAIVSGGADGTLRLWDLTGRQIGKPFRHGDWVRAVAFSPQGDRIVSGGKDGTLRLWDLGGWQIGDPFQGHGDWVLAVAFSPQGDRIASGGGDNTLRLWDLGGRQLGDPFQGHGAGVRAVAFSPQGDRILSGGRDGTLRLWDLRGRQIGSAFQGHGDLVNAVAFNPQGDRIVSGGDDGTLRLWDLAGRQLSDPFQGHGDLVNAVAFSPQGDRIVSGGDDGTLRLWDLAGRQLGDPFQGHGDWVLAVAFSPQGDRIVSGGDDGTLRLWDLAGRQLGDPFQGHGDWVLAVAFSPQGDRIVSGGKGGTLRLWDLGGRQLGDPFQSHGDFVFAVAFSPQGDRIVSGGDDGTLRLWDLGGRQIGDSFQGHGDWVLAVAFSPQGDRIVSGGNDDTLRLWDLTGRQIGDPFQGHGNWVGAVAFNPQGDAIISGGHDGTLRLWDLGGRQIGDPFQGHGAGVNAVAFSPQGDAIVSGGKDGTLRLWPGGTWRDWLYCCGQRLLRHPALTQPSSDLERGVLAFLQEQVWTEGDLAQYYQAQSNGLGKRGNGTGTEA
ncbi:caspase family protein [Leptolyngbya sp. PCC 6406]|uniref:nSTAND1 domain-containing NTPase n=1 Tax=Leptolyngbya sp. PCC 6406 TaxID=1173264 RepID=UPI0002ABE49E|nr:caspase family protein [Leptolyngbya sp. PCC 6406]